jgi:hypothetical protein
VSDGKRLDWRSVSAGANMIGLSKMPFSIL